MRRLIAFALLCGAVLQGGAAEQAPDLIRTWGHGSRQADYAGALVNAWERGFAARHPGVRFSHTLRGTSTGIGGLYTGVADLALMEREPIAIELDAYRPIFNSDPFEIVVASGSVDVAHHNPAVVVLVHRDNPLRKLTLAQLDAIIGADHRRGAAPILRWGDLGLTGAWADQPISVLAPALATDDARFVEQTVMGGSQKWTGRLREFPAAPESKDPSHAIAAALAADRYAIAVTTLVKKNSATRPLALSAAPGAPFLLPTRANVASQRYPLGRKLSIYLHHDAGTPLRPDVRDYLQYILGPQGQAAIARDGRYLPLPPDLARRERNKLQ